MSVIRSVLNADGICGICFNSLKEGEVVVHAGGELHPIHKECVTRWAESRNYTEVPCPSCRVVLDSRTLGRENRRENLAKIFFKNALMSGAAVMVGCALPSPVRMILGEVTAEAKLGATMAAAAGMAIEFFMMVDGVQKFQGDQTAMVIGTLAGHVLAMAISFGGGSLLSAGVTGGVVGGVVAGSAAVYNALFLI